MSKSCFEMIEEQRGALSEGHPARLLGLQLAEICAREPDSAELIAQDLENESMSLAACERKLRAWAGTQKRIDGCVCVAPDVAERIIREFYGLRGMTEGDCRGPAGLAMTEDRPDPGEDVKQGMLDLLELI